MSSENLSDSEKEFAKFFERDFTQCFEQMRHYDAQIFGICKFALTAYSAVLGASLALYQYGVKKHINYQLASVAIIIAGLLLGVCFIAFVTRNRAYFVVVSRYINEHRAFFLARRPLGFKNETRMYANPRQPPFFNWRSSQTLLLVVMAGLNSFLLATAYFIMTNGDPTWRWLIIASLGFWIVQFVTCSGYLVSRENKGASQAIFGD